MFPLPTDGTQNRQDTIEIRLEDIRRVAESQEVADMIRNRRDPFGRPVVIEGDSDSDDEDNMPMTQNEWRESQQHDMDWLGLPRPQEEEIRPPPTEDVGARLTRMLFGNQTSQPAPQAVGEEPLVAEKKKKKKKKKKSRRNRDRRSPYDEVARGSFIDREKMQNSARFRLNFSGEPGQENYKRGPQMWDWDEDGNPPLMMRYGESRPETPPMSEYERIRIMSEQEEARRKAKGIVKKEPVRKLTFLEELEEHRAKLFGKDGGVATDWWATYKAKQEAAATSQPTTSQSTSSVAKTPEKASKPSASTVQEVAGRSETVSQPTHIVVQSSTSVVNQPPAPAPIVIQPVPMVVRLSAPVVVPPPAPVIVQPPAPVVVQPPAPVVAQPQAPVIPLFGPPREPVVVRQIPVAVQPDIIELDPPQRSLRRGAERAQERQRQLLLTREERRRQQQGRNRRRGPPGGEDS